MPPPLHDSLILLPAQFEGRRDFDFDGDGMGEIIFVRGGGPAWDSVDLNLEIRTRRHYEAHVWTQRHSTSLYEVPEDSAITHKIRTLGIREEEYADFEGDVMSRPMYRYHVGGESSVGITWSAVLRSFVETRACC